MSLKYWLAPAVAVALMAPPAIAQTAPAGQTTPPEAERPADRTGTATGEARPGDQQTTAATDERRDAHTEQHVTRADRLIGQVVRDARDQRLGRVNDLAVNVDDKRVAYAVVNRGGVWGIGGEEVAVEWNQLQRDPAQRVVRIDEQRLQQARQIDTGTAWPMEIGEGPVGTAGAAPEHGVLPMSTLIGMDVHNKQGERLGQIDDIALGHDGSLEYAVIAHGGFLGVGDRHVAVPFDRLTLDAQRQGAVLDVSQQQLEGAREFEYRETWPERVDWPFSGDDRQGATAR